MLLPFSSAGPFLSTRSNGRYGLQEFYNTFIQPGFAADNALWAPLQTWFRLAATQDVNNNPVLGVTPVTTGIPADTAGLNASVIATKNGLKRMAAPFGPGASLTGVQFAAGIQDLRTTIQDTTTERMEFDRDRARKSFTDLHGVALAEQIQRLCGAGSDADLPNIHILMA